MSAHALQMVYIIALRGMDRRLGVPDFDCFVRGGMDCAVLRGMCHSISMGGCVLEGVPIRHSIYFR